MHVIWAQGQETNRYIHSPKSGLERDHASVKDFYRQDELKYHGHGAQRGQTTINFFGKLFIYHQHVICVPVYQLIYDVIILSLLH
jgi:hypothetical protein